MNSPTKGMLYLIGLVVIGVFCFYIGRFSRISSQILPISIYDEGELIEISIEDVGKYHGDICPCVAVTFRATQLAIRELWKDKMPERMDFRIISRCPTLGSQDVIDFITRAKTGENRVGDFKIELPEGTNYANMTRNNFSFIFIRKSIGDSIEILVKEKVFPKGFFNLRKSF